MKKRLPRSAEGFPILQQVAGEGRGRSFELSIDEVKIGRADMNDIVIPHDSVSREHAHIEKGKDGEYVIFDNGSKNGVVVNGNKVDARSLKDGDVIQLGVFGFKFLGPEPIENYESGHDLQEVGQHIPAYGDSKANVGPKSKRPIIYGGAALVLIMVYMMSGGNTTKDEKKGGTSEEANKTAGERFQASEGPGAFPTKEGESLPGLDDPTLKSAEQEMTKLDFANQSVQEAELYFRRGQREYFNKNWHRAIDAFNTSLAIYKKHPLAEFYLRASIFEAEKEAKVQMEMAVKYFESLQYKRAIYHFQQVISLLAHRQNEKVVSDSRKYIEIANRKLQASELFP